jgi:hypothetical protein
VSDPHKLDLPPADVVAMHSSTFAALRSLLLNTSVRTRKRCIAISFETAWAILVFFAALCACMLGFCVSLQLQGQRAVLPECADGSAPNVLRRCFRQCAPRFSEHNGHISGNTRLAIVSACLLTVACSINRHLTSAL